LCRIGVVQMCSGVSPVVNLEIIRERVAAAAQAGATYVLTPEVSVAYARDAVELACVAVPFAQNPALDYCAALAREFGLWLHIGSMSVALDDGGFANRSVVFGPDGALLAIYDKIHLFDADPPGEKSYRESDIYRAGEVTQVVPAAGFKLGMTICFDVRFPALYAVLAEAGCEVLAVPAAFTVPTGRAHWEVLLRARAIETGSFVVAAAQGGRHENGRQTWGHSMIIDPWGRILAAMEDDQPGLLVADIDLDAVKDARMRLPALANRRVFSLSVNHDLS